jgi:uncharacterized protein (DUF736 family)
MILLSCRNWQKKEETGRVTFSCIADFAASRPSRYSGEIVTLKVKVKPFILPPTLASRHLPQLTTGEEGGGWCKRGERDVYVMSETLYFAPNPCL